MPQIYYADAVIANGGTTSGVVSTTRGTNDPGQDLTLVGVLIPSAFTGTSITILAGGEGISGLSPIYDPENSMDYTLTVTAGKWIPIDPARTVLGENFQIKSGSAEGAARTLKLAFRKVL